MAPPTPTLSSYSHRSATTSPPWRLPLSKFFFRSSRSTMSLARSVSHGSISSWSLANAAAKFCGTISGLEERAWPNFTKVGPRFSKAAATRWALVVCCFPSVAADDQKASQPRGVLSWLDAEANLAADAMRGTATSRTATEATSAARRAIRVVSAVYGPPVAASLTAPTVDGLVAENDQTGTASSRTSSINATIFKQAAERRQRLRPCLFFIVPENE